MEKLSDDIRAKSCRGNCKIYLLRYINIGEITLAIDF